MDDYCSWEYYVPDTGGYGGGYDWYDPYAYGGGYDWYDPYSYQGGGGYDWYDTYAYGGDGNDWWMGGPTDSFAQGNMPEASIDNTIPFSNCNWQNIPYSGQYSQANGPGGLWGWLTQAGGDLASFLNTDTGKTVLTGLSGLLGNYFKSEGQNKQQVRASIEENIKRQGWAPELVNKFMASLDQYNEYIRQMPPPGFGPEERALWEQEMANLKTQGGLTGDIRARQGLEQAYQEVQPYQQYANAQALMGQYLNKTEAQIAKELRDKYGMQVGFSTSGPAMEAMLQEDQAARIAALQNAVNMETQFGQMFQQGAPTRGQISQAIGNTYPSMQNMPNYLAFAGAPRRETLSNVLQGGELYAKYPQLVGLGFNAAMQPSTTYQTKDTGYRNQPGQWWYAGLADAVKNLGGVLGTKQSKEKEE